MLDFLDPPRRPNRLGQLGPYEILEVIGRGAMGVVLKGIDPALQRTVAIKVLARQLALSAPARDRFLREARAAAAISHENVVRLHAIEDQGRHPYLVMDYVAGTSLQQRLDHGGPIALGEVLQIGEQIAAGLAAAHARGVVHRDVKPANVLLEGEPGASAAGGRVKLTDFGLAREGESGLTEVGAAAGTPLYMAPEQARGEAVDHRADLFALGAVLYRLCAGRPPFEAGNALALLRRICEEEPTPIRAINPAVPLWLAELITRLLAKDPAGRPQSAGEVAELFRYYLDHPDQDARPRRPWRVRRLLAVTSLLVLAGLATSEILGQTRLLSAAVDQVRGLGTLTLDVDDAIAVTVAGQGVVHRCTGPSELRLGPGRYDVRAVQEGRLLREENLTLPRFGQLEVSVRSPAGQAPTKPFVIPAREGDPRLEFDTLAEAFADALPGETIEVHGNGPFVFKPMTIDQALIVRAAPGFRPVLRHTTGGTGALLSNKAALVLEGLEFDGLTGVEDPERRRQHIYANGAPLFVANCRFTLNGPNHAVTSTSPLIEFRNCDFSINGWAALWNHCPNTATIRLDGNLLRPGRTAYFLDPGQLRGLTLELTRNTWADTWVPVELRLASPTAPQMERPLRVLASANVFDGWPLVLFNQNQEQPLVADDAEALLERLLSWKGERNLFREGTDLLHFTHRFKGLEGPAR
jgi:serine/threonine protein kinase